MSEPVRLAIDDSSRYTLTHRQGTGEISSTGTVSVLGNRLILDGYIVAPRALAGAPVRHYVWRTNDGLVGTLDTFFLGHRVQPELLLESRP